MTPYASLNPIGNAVLSVLVFALMAIGGCARPSRPVPAPALVVVQEVPREANKPADDVPKPAPPAPKEGFEFPKDKGGQELAKLLPAGVGVTLPPEPLSAPQPRTAPHALTDLSLPLSRAEVGPAQLPSAKSPPPPRPGRVKEDVPFIGYLGSPQTPVSEPLPTGVLVRVPSPDVTAPLAPPVLGQPTIDRAPLDDPTTEASREAALAAQLPARVNPVPFQKNSLPDPFENRQTGCVRTPPPEDPAPIAGRPSKP